MAFRDYGPSPTKTIRTAQPTYMTSPGRYPTQVQNAYANYQRTQQPAAPKKAQPRPAAAPVPPVQQPAAQQPAAAAPQPQGNPYDYSSDPVLQAIRAGGIRQRAEAESAALAGRKQLAIELGDATGIVDDSGTAQAAKGNSFSTLAEIMRGYDRTQQATNENLNQANLFFSGHRATELGRLLEDRNRQEYGARSSAQQRLAGINSTLAQQLTAALNADMEAEAAAKDRAQQQALMYGFDPGAGAPGEGGPPPTALYDPRIEMDYQRSALGRMLG